MQHIDNKLTSYFGFKFLSKPSFSIQALCAFVLRCLDLPFLQVNAPH